VGVRRASVRLLLEAHAVERATSRISELELRELKRALAMLAPHVIEGGLDAADNNLITTILYQLREKIRWIMPTSAATLDRQNRALRELQGIVEALQARDATAAVARMRRARSQCCSIWC
jgi:DNA-binding GntR family transcriptional regulator